MKCEYCDKDIEGKNSISFAGQDFCSEPCYLKFFREELPNMGGSEITDQDIQQVENAKEQSRGETASKIWHRSMEVFDSNPPMQQVKDTANEDGEVETSKVKEVFNVWSRPNIYLDIDGVLLANDAQPALHADEFIKYLIESHDVYWCTTHCRHPGDDPVAHLSRHFDEKTLDLLKQIKPTQWDMLKTEAIDFSQPFLWFDDDCFESEREVLQQNNALDSWVEVDLTKNPSQLFDEIQHLKAKY